MSKLGRGDFETREEFGGDIILEEPADLVDIVELEIDRSLGSSLVFLTVLIIGSWSDPKFPWVISHDGEGPDIFFSYCLCRAEM